MSTPDQKMDVDAEAETAAALETAESEPKRKLDLAVEISATGPCKKHVKVSIPRSEIERQFTESLNGPAEEAAMQGPGRTPSAASSSRSGTSQRGFPARSRGPPCSPPWSSSTKTTTLNPISQPQLVAKPSHCPTTARCCSKWTWKSTPSSSCPPYEGLKLKRPVKVISDADVEAQLKQFLERYAQLVPKLEGVAEIGDYVVADLHFHRHGATVNRVKEAQFRVEPELRFQDGHVPELAKRLVGAKPGDVREAMAHVGSSSADAALRGQTLNVSIQVHDLKKLRLPEVDAKFLDSIGFDTIEDLKQGLRELLERRLKASASARAAPTRFLAQLLEGRAVRSPRQPWSPARSVRPSGGWSTSSISRA